MENPKALSLLREVIAKTNARKLPWKETAEENVFIVPMKGEYTLKAFGFTEYSGGGPTGPPSLSLFEGDNMVLDITIGITGIRQQELEALYDTVKRQVLRLDEKVDDALDFLKNL